MTRLVVKNGHQEDIRLMRLDKLLKNWISILELLVGIVGRRPYGTPFQREREPLQFDFLQILQLCFDSKT